MRLEEIAIHNFKCYKDLKLENLHPNMNILLGNNGTGKSSLLEAIRVIIGSLYLSFDKYDNRIYSPGITDDDVRLALIDKNLETQFPCSVCGKAKVNSFEGKEGDEKEISWKRSIETKGGKTLYREAKQIQEFSKQIQQSVRDGRNQTIPLVAYFSTDRYKKERRDTNVQPTGSRLQGYFNALDSNTSLKFFLDLLYTETLDELQNQTESVVLKVVYNSISKCLNSTSLFYHLKNKELMVGYANSTQLPFSLLSDGVRSTLALVMELAFRCYLLNPQLGENATLETNGVVLIDEVDLHLHTSWQIHILNDLHDAFPKIQFIVTTHAPLIISQVSDCMIYSIQENQIYNFPNQNGRDSNYILQQMNVPYVKSKTKEKLDDYFGLIERGKGKSVQALRLRRELEAILGGNHAELERADMLISFF